MMLRRRTVACLCRRRSAISPGARSAGDRRKRRDPSYCRARISGPLVSERSRRQHLHVLGMPTRTAPADRRRSAESATGDLAALSAPDAFEEDRLIRNERGNALASRSAMVFAKARSEMATRCVSAARSWRRRRAGRSAPRRDGVETNRRLSIARRRSAGRRGRPAEVGQHLGSGAAGVMVSAWLHEAPAVRKLLRRAARRWSL